MPLGVFIEVYCNENYTLLGTSSQIELVNNWRDLLTQYEELIGGKDVLGRVTKIKQIYLMQSKLARANAAITIANINPNKDTFNKMYTFGYQLPGLEFTLDNFNKILAAFTNGVKAESLRFEIMVREYEEVNKSNTEKTNRESFINMVVALSQHFKLSIDENIISVEKYCLYVRRYAKEMELITKQSKKHG